MKNILICNQKGGVGKSTIADNLAWSLERSKIKYNFYDLDAQGGVIHKTQEVEGAEYSIIDTPGSVQPDLGKWVEAADVIIIPTGIGVNEVGPLQNTMEHVKNHAKCPVIYVINFVNNFKTAKAFEGWLYDSVGKATVIKLPRSEPLAQAALQGKSIVEYKKRDKAAKAILEICNAVRKAVGIKPEKI